MVFREDHYPNTSFAVGSGEPAPDEFRRLIVLLMPALKLGKPVFQPLLGDGPQRFGTKFGIEERQFVLPEQVVVVGRIPGCLGLGGILQRSSGCHLYD
jgi:hypothetical protein